MLYLLILRKRHKQEFLFGDTKIKEKARLAEALPIYMKCGPGFVLHYRNPLKEQEKKKRKQRGGSE